MTSARPRSWFLASIAIIPFVYSTAIIDPAFTPRAVLLGVLTLATIFATRREPLRTSPLLWIWCAYAAFNIASIFVATNSGEAIYQASLTLLYGAWLFAAMQMVTKPMRGPTLRTISVIGFIVAFIALFQYFNLGFDFIPGWGVPAATMTTKNLLSSFLFLTLPATTYLTLTDRTTWNGFWLLTWSVSIFVLLAAHTRAVWIGSCVFLLGFFVLFTLSAKRSDLWMRYRRKLAWSVGAIAFCLFAMSVFQLGPRSIINQNIIGRQFASLAHYSTDTSAQMRLTVWNESLQMMRDHPLGVGAGNWKIAVPHYGLSKFPANVQDGSVQWTETHNDLLQSFCETSSLGGLCFLAVFVSGIMLVFRASRSPSNTSAETILAMLIVSGICGYFVISFFDFPNSCVEHTMLFFLWLAMIPSRSSANRKKTVAWLIIPVFGAIPALLLSMERYNAEIHEQDILEARIDHDWENEIAGCNKIYDAKLLSMDALCTPLLYYKAEGEFMQSNYDAALRDNLEALKAHPNHFYTMNNTGSAYVKLGNDRAGEAWYRRALAISPNFEESLLNLTAVYFNRHEYDSARIMLARCDTSQPDSRAAQYARTLDKVNRGFSLQ